MSKFYIIEKYDRDSRTVGGVSRTNDVPYIEYVLSFLKNKFNNL
jgi:hypothetical protein